MCNKCMTAQPCSRFRFENTRQPDIIDQANFMITHLDSISEDMIEMKQRFALLLNNEKDRNSSEIQSIFDDCAESITEVKLTSEQIHQIRKYTKKRKSCRINSWPFVVILMIAVLICLGFVSNLLQNINGLYQKIEVLTKSNRDQSEQIKGLTQLTKTQSKTIRRLTKSNRVLMRTNRNLSKAVKTQMKELKPFKHSKTLTTNHAQKEVQSLFYSNTNFKLLYRASRDGWKATDFH